MRLIDGSTSNGTYAAEIPPQIKNTTVFYFVYFKDDLNYNYSSATCLPAWLNASQSGQPCSAPPNNSSSYYVGFNAPPPEFIHNAMQAINPHAFEYTSRPPFFESIMYRT